MRNNKLEQLDNIMCDASKLIGRKSGIAELLSSAGVPDDLARKIEKRAAMFISLTLMQYDDGDLFNIAVDNLKLNNLLIELGGELTKPAYKKLGKERRAYPNNNEVLCIVSHAEESYIIHISPERAGHTEGLLRYDFLEELAQFVSKLGCRISKVSKQDL